MTSATVAVPPEVGDLARSIRVGIDASNLRVGGGVTHLAAVLGAAEPAEAGVARVVVWGGRRTLDRLPVRPWLELVRVPELDGNLLRRLAWQHFYLTRLARSGCDVLWAPGGAYTGPFQPFVTMSRNMLPFAPREARRYRGTATGLRLSVLTRVQTSSFRRAAGVIFLTAGARDAILGRIGPIAGRFIVIPHGVSPDFRAAPRPQRPLAEYDATRPFRWLYVSIVDEYKHQWEVAEAVTRLRATGQPVAIDFVGPANPRVLPRLLRVIERHDPSGSFLRYRGGLPHDELAAAYRAADGAVFASTCENMPNILLESMAAGLPLACSASSPMPEVLGDAGVYFDAEDPTAVAAALDHLAADHALRARLAERAYERALAYSWSRSARESFAFIASVARAARREPGG